MIVSSYESQRTLSKCLSALEAQTHRDFETVVVDSSPHRKCESIVREGHPGARYIRSEEPLVRHLAQNLGVANARAGESSAYVRRLLLQ